MTSILVAIDFSKNSFHSAYYGGILAKQLNAKITFLNLYSIPIVSEYNLPNEIENMITSSKIDAQQKMDSFVQNFVETTRIPNQKIDSRVDYGFVAEKIVDISKSINADMIVMGSKGITNAFDRWIGSIAQKVKNLAECPVWVVPEHASLVYPKEVLYAADFDGDEIETVNKLLKITKPLDAKCDVVHVHTSSEPNFEEEIEAMVSYLEDTFEQEKITFASTKSDDIIEGLEKYLKIHKPNVLAMATHEKAFLDKLFLKSVSKHFMQEAKLPMLCIKK
jgi:nucleotide-binding universal stress UspA family protein